MADRAHIRHDGAVWQLLDKYNREAKIHLEDGRTTCATIGLAHGNDKIVAVEIPDPNDTSTGAKPVKKTRDEAIEGGAVGVYAVTDRILVTRTIRDLTDQEVIDRGTDTVNGNYSRLDDDELLDANRNILFRHHNSIRVLDEAVKLLAAATATDVTSADEKKWLKPEFDNYYKARIQDAVDNA